MLELELREPEDERETVFSPSTATLRNSSSPSTEPGTEAGKLLTAGTSAPIDPPSSHAAEYVGIENSGVGNVGS